MGKAERHAFTREGAEGGTGGETPLTHLPIHNTSSHALALLSPHVLYIRRKRAAAAAACVWGEKAKKGPDQGGRRGAPPPSFPRSQKHPTPLLLGLAVSDLRCRRLQHPPALAFTWGEGEVPKFLLGSSDVKSERGFGRRSGDCVQIASKKEGRGGGR